MIHIRERIERLLKAPGSEMSRWARLVRYQIQLWRYCGRRLRDHNSGAMSAALSFRTMFALVPVIVLGLLVTRSLGLLAYTENQLRAVLDASGLGQIQIVSETEPDRTEPISPWSAPARDRRPGRSAAPDDSARTRPTTQTTQKVLTTRPEATPKTTRRSLSDVLVALVRRVENKLTLGRVGPVGIILVIWSALALLTTMERSLNRVFEAPRSRPLGSRTMLYWSAVTLGPLLLVVVSVAGSWVTRWSMEVPVLSWLLRGVGWLGPVVMGVALLASLYKLMPNTRVNTRSAIMGAIVAVPLWLLAEWAFGLYIRELVVSRETSLYGALGLLPLFLIWLNLSWLLFLFGAELAHTAANLHRIEAAESVRQVVLGPSAMLATALAVAWKYDQGNGAVDFKTIAAQIRLPNDQITHLLERLEQMGMVATVERRESTAYVLARPAEKATIAELLELSRVHAQSIGPGQCSPRLGRLLENVQRRTAECVGQLTLRAVLDAAGEGDDNRADDSDES